MALRDPFGIARAWVYDLQNQYSAKDGRSSGLNMPDYVRQHVRSDPKITAYGGMSMGHLLPADQAAVRKEAEWIIDMEGGGKYEIRTG